MKLLIRNATQGLLSSLPPSFHRYLLSCYQNVPGATLPSGYNVLRDLTEGQSADEATNVNYLEKNAMVRKMFAAASEPVIFDVGANIGQTSSGFAPLFPGAKLHAFEPFAENFEHLKANTKDVRNLKTHHLALSNHDGSLTVRRDNHPLSQWNSISPTYQEELAAQGSFTEEVITLASGKTFCTTEGINEIFLLKIDTEGHEMEVLDGFGDMFANNRIQMVLIEVGFGMDEGHGNFQEINAFLVKHGLVLCTFCDTAYQKDTGVNYSNALYIHSRHFGGV